MDWLKDLRPLEIARIRNAVEKGLLTGSAPSSTLQRPPSAGLEFFFSTYLTHHSEPVRLLALGHMDRSTRRQELRRDLLFRGSQYGHRSSPDLWPFLVSRSLGARRFARNQMAKLP